MPTFPWSLLLQSFLWPPGSSSDILVTSCTYQTTFAATYNLLHGDLLCLLHASFDLFADLMQFSIMITKFVTRWPSCSHLLIPFFRWIWLGRGYALALVNHFPLIIVAIFPLLGIITWFFLQHSMIFILDALAPFVFENLLF